MGHPQTIIAELHNLPCKSPQLTDSQVSTTCIFSMIFKTFNSDSDKVLSKIGILGKSFEQIGTSIRQRKIEIDNLIGAMSKKEANAEVGGFWSYLFGNESIKEKPIDLSKFIELDEIKASNLLKSLQEIEVASKTNISVWQEHFSTLSDGQKWQIEFVKNNDLQKTSTEDLVKANQQARASALAHNEAIKAQTLSAKAGKVALQALATVGNMFAIWAFTKAIQLAVTAIDNYIHRVEKAKEAMESSVSSYETTKSELESINSELKTQSKRMDELLAKDKLTYVEKGELEELQAITKELEVRQRLKEKEEQRNAKQVIDKTLNAYHTEFDGQIISDESISQKSYSDNISLLATANEHDISALIAAYQKVIKLRDSAYGVNDEEYLRNKEFADDIADVIWEQVNTLQIYKENLSSIPYDELSIEAQTAFNEIDNSIRTVWKTMSPDEWNQMQINDLFNSSDIEKTENELIKMAKAGKLTPDVIEGYTKLNKALQDADLFLQDGQTAAQAFCEQMNASVDPAKNLSDFSKNPISLNLSTYKDQISDIQSSISTLRSALDSLNSGDLSKIEVIDLMQKFPELAPYIDLTADGFGNLSEGLSRLMEQQPSSLINELEKLKDSLNTDEERKQVDLLIDSLQRLSSYGDSGMEAYAASMGNTWTDTQNVIDGVVTQFENLAKVQEAVSNGLTMSAMAATELAKIYPEILTNATVTADGQMKLNEEVVKNILAGDQSIINAQIAKLEADKAELEAKQKVAIAELEIAKNVGTAKGQITEEEAKNQIEALEAELQAELDKDKKVVESYATATESKMNNASQFNTHAGQVASDVATNMLNAAVSMAANMKVNSENSQQSLTGIGHKAAEVAKSIIAMSAGESVDVSDKIFQGKGGTKSGAIKIVNNTRRLSSATRKYLDGNSDLEDFKSQMEIDIQGYTDAISNIDSQINVLKKLQANFTNAAGSGIGGHGYADKIKDLEKEKDKINKALDDAKSGGGSAGDTKDEYEELFDFFEQRIKVLSAALSLLKSGIDNVIGSFAKNSLIDAQLNVTEEKFNNYTDALAMYTQKANEALSELPTDIADKIKNGAVDLTTFIGEGNEGVIEAIKVYQTWADKVSDCRQELEELKAAIRQLELDKFNNIAEDFANQFNLHQDGKDLISKQIDLLKEAGELIGESFFTTQIDQSKKQLEVLENEKAQLVDQMESALSSGRVDYCPLL